MTYAETLDYIFHKLPMFTRVGAAAYKKDLTNTIQLCAYLNNPHQKFKSIHIGGTNGKGSTSHMLAAILQSAGYKTGLYTSPHLYDFRERIRINGEMIPEENVVSFIEKIQPLINSLEPSFFEITVAMAFAYFAAQEVDIAIIEVGLGGRLDSTNVVLPILSVITNISLDHTAMLGGTVQEIAGEKAGIIKKEVPVIIGEKDPDTKNVFLQKASEQAAPIIFASDEYETADQVASNGLLELTVINKRNGINQTYQLDLSGFYQTKNICTVLAAADRLRELHYKISNEVLQQGLAHTKRLTGLMGRWDVWQQNPTIIADVAHNESGIKAVLQQLKSMQYQQLHLVIGMVKDKEINQVLSLLPIEARYYFTQAAIPRALPAADLKQQAVQYQLAGDVYASVNEAIMEARENADVNDLILICGSIFLIAEIDRTLFQ